MTTVPVTPGEYDCDVLVIGAGPSGSSCAYWLAKAGHDVVLVEKKAFPREKTCGDGLTPRSVRQLQDMGLGPELASCHRFEGLRSHGFGRSLVMPWPVVKGLPPYGYVVTRKDLDGLVAGMLPRAGPRSGSTPRRSSPSWKGRPCAVPAFRPRGRTATAGQVTARYVVVADGANSRFGWSLGNQRKRAYPQGMALRGYWSSPRHDEPWIDSWLDLKDEAGNAMPGYGWIFPLGDGRINVGVGLLSTGDRWKGVNTTQMLEAFCATSPLRGDQARDLPRPGHRRPAPDGPFGRPEVGPSHLVVGDAGGSINPFNGEGITYGYETGRMAAQVLHEALRQAVTPCSASTRSASRRSTASITG